MNDQAAGVGPVDRGVRPLVDKRGDICTLALYEVLADLANEAGAVDTVIGRPRVLYERLCSLRDIVGAVKASAAHSTLPALPKPRVLASGMIAGKAIELRGWHTDDIEIWERQHGLKFGA